MNFPSGAKSYLELVLVTTGSLVAANLWADWIQSFLNKRYKDNLLLEFAIALSITMLVVFGLYYLFGSKSQ